MMQAGLPLLLATLLHSAACTAQAGVVLTASNITVKFPTCGRTGQLTVLPEVSGLLDPALGFPQQSTRPCEWRTCLWGHCSVLHGGTGK